MTPHAVGDPPEQSEQPHLVVFPAGDIGCRGDPAAGRRPVRRAGPRSEHGVGRRAIAVEVAAAAFAELLPRIGI